MEKRTLARPYAKAIFEYAKANNTYESWSLCLQLLSFIVKDSGVSVLLRNITLTETQLYSFFLDLCANKLSDSQKNFLKLLSENRRLNLLPEIAALYDEFGCDVLSLARIQLITTKKLLEHDLLKITQWLKQYLNKKVEIHTKINPQILGGFIARMGSTIIDASLQGQLAQLKMVIGR